MVSKGKKKVSIIIVIIALLVVSVSTFFVASIQKNKSQINSEILRSKSYTEITENDAKIDNCDYVQFSAFFTRDLDGDGDAERLLGSCQNLNSTDELYFDINVLTDGTLKNGVITIESSNFKYSMNMVKDSVLKNNYISSDVEKIELNDVKAGTQKLIIGNIKPDLGSDINNYSSTSTVKLTGTHVADDGVTETPIEKEFTITVDWHGETKAEVYKTVAEFCYTELTSNTLNFTLQTKELNQNLLLKENVVTLEIPDLQGYNPTEVICANSNITYEYDADSQILTITRNSVIDENGILTTVLSAENFYDISITYPEEAFANVTSYTELEIPAQTYYTGYNNSNDEFENPYKSNISEAIVNIIFKETPDGEIYNFYVNFEDKKQVTTPNKRYVISKQKLLNAYNEENSENIKYTVSWRAARGPVGNVSSMIMSEDAEYYGDRWDDQVISEYVNNVAIYFSGANGMLTEDGYINIYNNDTNELLKTFTKDDWNNYSAKNPYTYETPVKHIRVETSATEINTNLMIYNIKELNTESIKSNFTIEQIEAINMKYTYLHGICNIEGQDANSSKRSDAVYYESEKSNVSFDIKENDLSTQEICTNQLITIEAISTQTTDAKWKNGQFLLEFPKEIINVQINDIKSTNSNVIVTAYDLYEKDGQYFVKIYTENEKPTTYDIKIYCTLVPDARIASVNKNIILYSYNENCDLYYYTAEDIYDIDDDENTSEIKGYRTRNLSLLSPTSLVTLETISNYNEENDITVGPNIAELEVGQEQATVNVVLTNNYPNSVSGIKVLGKIPFEGNTHILNTNNLNSEFSTTMTAEGIKLPTELEGTVDVYYSELETTNNNINDSSNNWKKKEDITDFSKIKTYLVDFKDNQIKLGESYSLSYNVNLPEEQKYNLASYSTHAVYYELNTDGGNLQLATEPNKVGLSFVRNYELNLTKYKKGTTLVVPKATYKLCELDSNNAEVSSRVAITNANGILKISDIYVDRKYSLKEIKSPINYSLNDDEMIFQVIEKDDGTLEVQVLSEDKFDITPVLELNSENEDILKVVVSDEPKYEITLTKLSAGNVLKDISFRVPELERMYTTNENGQIEISGLEQNKEYTLSEVSAEGYYLLDDISFKLVKQDDGTFKIESSNTEFANATISNTAQEDLIKVNINLNNEKVPTYNLQIVKIEATKDENIDNSKKLQGAKFEFKGKDLNIQETFITDENGIINISDLFVYVDGRDITGEYSLQEIEAPTGYSNNAEEIKFKIVRNSEQNLEIQIENLNDLTTLKSSSVDGNTVKFVVENKPSFKLVKTDSDTNEKLEGVEFVIFELNSDGTVLDYAKNINGEYIGEKNEDNQYILKTDANGEIVLPLKDGKYRAIEIKYLEGYVENDAVYDFIVGEEQDTETEETYDIPLEIVDDTELELEVDSIEDLMEIATKVNNGSDTYSYDGKLVKLTRTLDFNEDSSYADPESTTYGDINENGTIEGIKQELTSRDGAGFPPIGINSAMTFDGTFDGQGYEIRNIYINTSKRAGLFGSIRNSTIKNLGMTGEINSTGATGAIVGYIYGYSKIENCYNKATIKSLGAYVGGVVGDSYNSQGTLISNCYNEGEIFGGGYLGGVASSPRSGDYVINCYNIGNVRAITGTSSYVGGICGYSGCAIVNCYNTGDVITNNFYGVGGVVGYADSNIINCYNTGKVTGTTNIGGVAGSAKEVSKCYNTGSVISGNYSGGGVAGNAQKIVQSYNTGNVIGVNNVFGIGNAEIIRNCYNEGDINGTNYISGIGPSTIENCYNQGNVKGTSIGSISYNPNAMVTNSYTLGDIQGTLIGSSITEEYSKSEEFYNKLNIDKVWIYYGTTHPKLGIGTSALIIEGTTLNLTNTKQVYKITTDVKEIDGIKGGTISGEDEPRYEEIVHGNDNTLEIIMDPDENFAISEITINDEKIVFNVNADGTYTIPAGYFEDVNEDKHIEVTYSLVAETLTINKVDENDNTIKLEGAEFKIEQQEDYRNKVTVGETIEDSTDYYVADKTSGNLNEVFGELTPINTTYYFEEVDGKIISNNKTSRTTSTSYIPIDLTGKTGNYVVELNAESSAHSSNDCYAHVTENTNATTSTTGRFILLEGTVAADNYTSAVLTGGKTYYLHLRYYNYKAGTGDDQFTINSVNIYPAQVVKYGFDKVDGKYISNNQGKHSTTAISYLPIDLTKNYGQYTITINAEISSQSNDIGYFKILETIGGTETQIAYIYGEKTAADYTRTVNGGKMYYLKLEYKKDKSTSAGTDTFTVNSIDISPVLSTTEGITDENGELKVRATYGKYKITEITAPEGYVIDGEPIIFEVLANSDNILTITNSTTPKKFNITTDVNEVNGVKGGTISGEDETPYEIVKINENNTKEIIITPEDGYVISKIAVNDENIAFTPDSEGNFTIPADYFTNVQEDKHIVVTFCKENQILTINKVDENDNTKKLANAKFNIKQIEHRTLPSDAIGASVANGELLVDTQKTTTVQLGTLTANNTSYYFVESDGKFVSNNTTGNTRSVSYVTLDLTGLTGYYRARINAEISTNERSYGFATVTTTTSAPTYSTSGRVFYIRDKVSAQDYDSILLEGGNTYYLHFSYYRSTTADGEDFGDDKLTINSVNIYGTSIYDYFEEVDGKYVSTNQNKNSTVAASYIPIDLSSATGKYNLTINAEISSELFGDYGYALVTTTTDLPTITQAIGGFAYITGNQAAKDYTTVLEGGNLYYLHLGYIKDDINSDGEDTFTVNSINLSLNQDDFYNDTLITNELGQIETAVPEGKYIITEIEAPEGYLLNSEPISYEMLVDGENNITIENTKKATVRVHYYVAGTGPEFGNEAQVLADDTIIDGVVNKEYTTSPKMDIQNYTLQTDENGEYIIPSNASGNFAEETIDVYYYYTKKPVNLVVHHYLEGTETKLAEDENYSYEIDETYKVTSSEEVLKTYDLVQVVGEEEKVITEDEVVTYYYKKKTYDISTRVEVLDGNEKGGTISGEDKDVYETVEHGEKSTSEIIANPDDGYRVKEIKLVSTDEEGNITETIIYGENPNSEITYTIDLDGNVKLTNFENVTQDKEIIVEFEKDDGRVIVHHYVENSTEKIYPDQVTVDSIGTEVTTLPVSVENYVVVEAPSNPDVTITKDTQEITYYYQRQYKVTTDIIKYQEPDSTGAMVDVIGGTISGKGETSYEDILKGRNSQKEIIMTPNEGFEIVKVTIDGVEYDFKDLLQTDGSVTLEKEFFKNVDKDIHVEVEFRRQTKVTVKYLEVDTENVVATEEVIEGYVGKEFETSRKNVTNYKTAELNITDENKVAIEPNGNMTVDEIIVIYWYEKIPSGIIVKHVEKERVITVNPDTGLEEITIKEILLEEEEIPGLAGNEQTTNRKTFEQYIASENVDATQGINVGKSENSKTVTFSPDEVLEVVYWYEKQYEITTNVIEHSEIDSEGSTISVKGGEISGEDETPYENAIKSYDSTKEIKITPEDGYRIKQVKINGEEIYVQDKISEDKTLILDKFLNVQENKHIEVEFEKIPAKVIVKYIDKDTNEVVIEDKVVDGFVNDEYNELRVNVDSYIPTEPEPTNATGTMTEDTITVTYYYTKQFKITTEVKGHEELDSENKVVTIKGGKITGEEIKPLEIVNRGASSIQEIIAEPDNGYRISKFTINGIDYEFEDLLDENKLLKLPVFDNMQEDKHIVVEFEKVPAKVIVKHIDETTGKELVVEEVIDGFVNDDYETQSKVIEEYELNEDKLPQNANGSMTEEDITVIYYYNFVEIKEEPKPEEPKEELEKPAEDDNQDSENLPESKPETNPQDKPLTNPESKPEDIKDNKNQANLPNDNISNLDNSSQNDITNDFTNLENIKTGDNIFVYVIVLVSAIIGIIIIILNKKGKKDK